MLTESTVQLSYALMIRVCHRKFRTPIDGTTQGIAKSNLVAPCEDMLVVSNETVHVVAHRVGGVDEQKVASPGRVNGYLKILLDERCALQGL